MKPDHFESLSSEFRPTIRAIAMSLWGLTRPRGFDVEDFEAAGLVGLHIAASRHDASRPFAPFARLCIRNAIRDWLREIDTVPQSVRREILAGTTRAPRTTWNTAELVDHSSVPPQQAAENAELWDKVHSTLATNARHLVIRHIKDGHPLGVVGRELGISRSLAKNRWQLAKARLQNAITKD